MRARSAVLGALGALACPLGCAAGAPIVGVVSLPVPPPAVSAPPAPVTASTPAAPPHVALAAASYLEPSSRGRFPWRALVRAAWSLRFMLDGEPITEIRSSSLPVDAIVVEEHPRSLRVVLDAGGLRLVVFADRDELTAATTRPVWVARAPDRAHGEGAEGGAGVRLAPGVALDTRGRTASAVEVSGAVDDVQFRGWVDEDAIGVRYVPRPFEGAAAAGQLEQGTEVVTPDGERVAVLVDPDEANGFMHDVTPLDRAGEGLLVVHLRRKSVEVRGLVRAAAYRPQPGRALYPRSSCRYCASGMATGVAVWLRRGTGIYTRDGARIGTALARAQAWVAEGEAADGPPLVRATLLLGVLGWVSAWLHRGDLDSR